MNNWVKIINQIAQIKVKSVTDSLFKYGAIILLIGVVAAIFTNKDWVVIFIFTFSGLFFILGFVFYCFFAIKKPDYLRSEKYQLNKQAVELLGDNERAQNLNLKTIPMIMNPYNVGNDDKENPMLK